VAQLPPDAKAPETGPAADATAGLGTPSDASVEAKLTPESQQILGTADAAPEKKSRMQQKESVSRKQKKAAIVAAKKRDAPAPPGADEVAAQAVNSAPLGLNGNTAAKQKAARDASAEKQRIQDKKTQTVAAQAPNPGTPGSTTTAATPASTTAPQKKRHKLLGIL
jgi:peptidyl-prolyl cis-trans isomerase SurA